MAVAMVSGRVVTGRGEAAAFTSLAWVREQLLTHLAIDPYPGTLNLIVDTAPDNDAWRVLRSSPGYPIDPPNADFCAGRCFPVRLNGRLPAGVILPDVPGYPATQVEVVAALPIREALAVADGDRVVLDACGPLPVRAVIFDVDGTLVDSLAAYRVVAERAAAPYGVTIADATVREALNTTRPFWDLALPADCADRAATMDALRRESARLWPEVLREHGRLYPGVAAVIDTLRRRGAKLGIVTASRRGSLDALQRAGLLERFDAVVTGEEVTRRKPDPEGLMMCASMLQVAPHHAAYVGDTPLDVEAARAAGMRALGVLGGAGDSAQLSAAGADRLVAAPGRVSEAVIIDHLTFSA